LGIFAFVAAPIDFAPPPAKVAGVHKKTPKRVFGALRPAKGQKAHRVSVSLYQAHKDIITQRETELNIGRSTLFQLLLEIDERCSLLRREVIQRLRGTTSNCAVNQERTTSNAVQEVPHLEHQ
jgi:hypothetical protein